MSHICFQATHAILVLAAIIQLPSNNGQLEEVYADHAIRFPLKKPHQSHTCLAPGSNLGRSLHLDTNSTDPLIGWDFPDGIWPAIDPFSSIILKKATNLPISEKFVLRLSFESPLCHHSRDWRRCSQSGHYSISHSSLTCLDLLLQLQNEAGSYQACPARRHPKGKHCDSDASQACWVPSLRPASQGVYCLGSSVAVLPSVADLIHASGKTSWFCLLPRTPDLVLPVEIPRSLLMNLGTSKNSFLGTGHAIVIAVVISSHWLGWLSSISSGGIPWSCWFYGLRVPVLG